MYKNRDLNSIGFIISSLLFKSINKGYKVKGFY